VRLQGPAVRSAITGITLIAGFASTVGWPLTAWTEAQIGGRRAQHALRRIKPGVAAGAGASAA